MVTTNQPTTLNNGTLYCMKLMTRGVNGTMLHSYNLQKFMSFYTHPECHKIQMHGLHVLPRTPHKLLTYTACTRDVITLSTTLEHSSHVIIQGGWPTQARADAHMVLKRCAFVLFRVAPSFSFFSVAGLRSPQLGFSLIVILVVTFFDATCMYVRRATNSNHVGCASPGVVWVGQKSSLNVAS